MQHCSRQNKKKKPRQITLTFVNGSTGIFPEFMFDTPLPKKCWKYKMVIRSCNFWVRRVRKCIVSVVVKQKIFQCTVSEKIGWTEIRERDDDRDEGEFIGPNSPGGRRTKNRYFSLFRIFQYTVCSLIRKFVC